MADDGRVDQQGADPADSGSSALPLEAPRAGELVDLDKQPPPSVEKPAAQEVGPKLVPYDPAPYRDRMRGYLAGTLVGILGFTIILSLGAAAFWPDRSQAILDVLNVILGPLVALVGAATGYYFGAGAVTETTVAKDATKG